MGSKEENEIMIRISGTYSIRNKINGHEYHGRSVDLYKRWKDHLGLLNNGIANRYFQHAWNKYGWSNFEFVIISQVELKDTESMIALEQWYLDTYPCEYNLNRAASGGGELGRKRSLETRQAISRGKMGKPQPNTSKALKGRKRRIKDPNCEECQKYQSTMFHYHIEARK